jgi:Holliday junction DNA helicase RuvA
MIATLTGIVSEKLLGSAVIEVNGVGYGVFVPSEDYNQLVQGEEAKFYIYEHVREQAHDLFGFLSRDTQNLFEQLLEVNGVGPKMALSLLSIGTNQSVRGAIASGDLAFIQQANGVGRRLAERVVVELKDKVGLTGVNLEDSGLMRSESTNTKDEALQALMALGYSMADAARALQDVDPELTTEKRVKQALKEVVK